MAGLIRPIRQFSPQCCNLLTLRQLFWKRQRHRASSIPTLFLFPCFSTARSLPRWKPAEALTPNPIGEDDGDSEGGEFEGLKSRNQRKREARRAVRWGMDLVSFSNDQVKQIVRAASLGEDVYDALMLAKRLGPDVREGKRRHFNYIGKLLREVEPDLMDTLIHATKHGDETKLQALISSVKDCTDDVGDSNDDESEDEVESSEAYMAMAARWFDGLISQNAQLTNQVYSLQSVDFDRQELRKLVRKVHLVHEQRKGITQEKQKEVDAAIVTAEKSLNRFLLSMAKQLQSGQTDLYL